MANDKFAFEGRKSKRVKSKKEFIEKVINPIIESNISKKLKESANSKQIEQLIGDTYFYLQNKYASDNKLKRWALNYLHKYENKLSKKFYFESNTYPVRLDNTLNSNFRSHDWFIKTSQLASWQNHLKIMLIDTKKLNSSEDLLAQILISASINGGLCFIEAQTTLCNALNLQRHPLMDFMDTYWFELILESNHYPFNDYKGTKEITNRRWFVDSYSLLLIYNYLKNNNKKTTKKLSTDNTWKLINNFLQKVAIDGDCDISEIKNQKDFFDASIGLLECNGHNISQYLLNYARGKVFSSSLSKKSFYPLIVQKILIDPENYKVMTEPTKAHTEKGLRPSVNRKNSKKGNVDPNDVVSVYDIIKAKYKNHNKIPKSKVIRALKEYKQETNIAMNIAFDWFIYLMEKSDPVVVRTIERYSSTFLKPWLKCTYKKDIFTMEADEFELVYENMIKSIAKEDVEVEDDDEKETKEQGYLRKRIKAFHKYGVEKFGFPSVIFSTEEKARQPTVRARYVSEESFDFLIQNLHLNSNLQKDIIWLYTSILFVAYRTGMRISELAKLKFKDVEFSGELWFEIRSNEKGDNKSPSAKRRIPVGILLPGIEKEYVINFLKTKYNLSGKRKNELVFSHLMNTKYTFDGAQMSECIHKNLNSYLELPVKFHDLRHSALSRLHAIFENCTNLIKRLSNYSDDEILKIQRYFNNEGKNSIWQIAGLAGHSSPEQTFISYLHFNDYFLYNSIKNPFTLNKDLTAQLSGFTKNKVTKLINTKNWSNDEIEIENLISSMKKDLGKFSVSIEKSLGKKNIVNKPQNNFTLISNSEDPSVTFSALGEYEKGQTVSDISKAFAMDTLLIKKWCLNSKILSLFGCPECKTKLFSHFDLILRIKPALPQNSSEKIQSEKIIKKIINKYQDNEEAVKNVILIFLHNSNRRNPGIDLNNKSDLSILLNLLIELVDKKDIQLNFYPLKNKEYKIRRKKVPKIPTITKQRAYWKKGIMNGISLKTVKNTFLRLEHPNGKLEVKVLRPKTEEKSRALGFAMHLLAINLFESHELSESLSVPFDEALDGAIYQDTFDRMIQLEMEIRNGDPDNNYHIF